MLASTGAGGQSRLDFASTNWNSAFRIEIDPLAPGYKHILLRPQPGGKLTEVSGHLKTLYGEVVSHWRMDHGTFEWTVVIPPNTTASVRLPAGTGGRVTMNGQPVSGLVHEVEAGEYRFIVFSA
jgi:alpha-L-rhamnosidase